jgi:beta-galactosidase
MLDTNPTTGWSNAFSKTATALLPAFNGARPADWVSLTWDTERRIGSLTATFTIDATHTLPATLTVSAWDGHRWHPARNQTITWATTTDTPTTITFTPLITTRLRLDLTSAHPGTPNGAQRITTLNTTDT